MSHPASASPLAPTDHTVGPASAKLVLIEYGDFECPSCAQAYPAVNMLLEHAHKQIRFAFRHFPMTEVHPHAELAAEAAEAAGAQGKFWEMHACLFGNPQHLKPADLRGYAQKIELDLERYDAETADRIYLQRVKEHAASGVAAGVRGTPSFFLDGVFVDVSFGFNHLRDAVDARLAKPR
jgi:protein-disulfide isomerase